MQDADLLQQLTDDTHSARQLLELTEQEFSALSKRDLQALEGILTSKQPLLALLAQHAEARRLLLSSHGLEADKGGLKRLASGQSDGERILEQTTALESLLIACQTANQRNGHLIQANRSAVGSMLSVLQGSNSPTSLYDNRGGATRTTQQRPLSQA
ncbi:flagellar protein FlgN [Stutzerimonas kirkiae]|uniref:flagellar protein FlgN n=1 Tax=Stutzerimonas kirkiae TaxID=2211392 RepID=UPI00103856F1|nr:flagellar protein FlgN [Stutzerimonas kirkiae]TBV16938.1 flagellar biosynthesis protein FlgN [Stutzerimonas kirkiae]